MTYIVKHESSRHAVIYDERTDYPHWIATVNTEGAPERAEAVLKAIEEAASANGAENK
jgi:hypothetical protein